MKFVALVGNSQALQNDAPSQMEHIKAAIIEYLTQLKETARKTLDHLDGLNTLSTSKRNTLLHLVTFTRLFCLNIPFPTTPHPSFHHINVLHWSLPHFTPPLLISPQDEAMRAKVEVTKSKLFPMVEIVRTKLTNRLEDLSVREVSPHTADLQSKLEPYFEDLKSRFMTFYDTASTAMKA
uniref:Uncharacterized protein n=1 Tax=Oncorhynchus mykiss TaxID=8022 RepID=A0A8K9UEY4_ONCMY